ncbi:flagellar hook protein FlgE [Epibacterium ulvae]|uniref:Flagellar hook protein FlgE n=2 Tax=Epibacterium ulvae TaxID=1156985 RepID=A0A1G5RJL4_9RHOB|nr:flagellar hook protein FlgE [Epibacterium ulvae]
MQQKGVSMSISSSLNAGVAALAANASRLGTISDNIANSSTYGYKRVETDFNSVITARAGGFNSASQYSAGGVRATTTRLIDERGSIVGTEHATDLAVRNRGMLPVANITEVNAGQAVPQMLLTSTGSFRTNEDGYLTTASGLVLLGFQALPDGTIPTKPRDTTAGLEPVRVNRAELQSEPTTEVTLGITLPASATEPGSTAVTADTTMSTTYYDNVGRSETLTVEFTPTIPAATAVASSNEWTMTITDSADGGSVIGTYTVTFDDSRAANGALAGVTVAGAGGAYDPVTGAVTVNVAGGPVEINLGLVGEKNGLSQVGEDFLSTGVVRDGAPAGNIVSVTVDDNGFVRAKYNTGLENIVYQVPLVDLPNLNGLEPLDRQTYLPTLESGPFFLWDAGAGPTGAIVSNALEESATDVAGELTDMIQTQRAYSSNAKVIQTVDEMLQETTNIKR